MLKLLTRRRLRPSSLRTQSLSSLSSDFSDDPPFSLIPKTPNQKTEKDPQNTQNAPNSPASSHLSFKKNKGSTQKAPDFPVNSRFSVISGTKKSEKVFGNAQNAPDFPANSKFSVIPESKKREKVFGNAQSAPDCPAKTQFNKRREKVHGNTQKAHDFPGNTQFSLISKTQIKKREEEGINVQKGPDFWVNTQKERREKVAGNAQKDPDFPAKTQKEKGEKVAGNTQKALDFPVKSSSLPFDFRYSYSESDPNVEPIGYREPPRFSPFGPGRLDREWTGTSAPVVDWRGREEWEEEKERVRGEPLSEDEVAELVERYRHSDCGRQINIGRGGVTHNLLDDIHNHWRRAEAVRIKCLGIPTLDMDNVCFHLEDKTGGKVIYRHINIILLYRGRNYDPKNRPVIPLMLWKPRAPIYPKLVKNVADGSTFEETKELRNRGLNSLALMKLSRNGVYVNVVQRVREAFESEEVVRLDCAHVGTSDCKLIGVKLRDLVPCVPILFKDEQIILWRGKKEQDWNPSHLTELESE